MSDLPERITATFNNWRNPTAGACYKNDTGDTEYIRKDIADAAVKAERERCAQVADAYADENISMAGDSVLFDPVLKSRPGETLTRADFEKSKNLILDGAIHSAMFHAAQNIAAAIRKGEQS